MHASRAVGWIVAALAGVLLAAAPAGALEYPRGNISFIVPFPPGGATDVMARLIAPRLSEALGVAVVIENVGGGGGTVGSARVAKAPADGQTLLMGTITSHGIVPSLYAKLPYDNLADFVPITQAAEQVYVVAVHPSVPVQSIEELIAFAKSQPGKLTYASGGNGSAAHLFAELFKLRTGTDIRHVPYRGSGPALNDLLGGHVSMTFEVLFLTLEHIRAGSLRALATTGQARSEALPETRTLIEAGLSDFNAVGWNGVFVRTGTPPAIIALLGDRIRTILREPEVVKKMNEQGASIIGSPQSEFDVFWKAEVRKWNQVIRSTGIKAD